MTDKKTKELKTDITHKVNKVIKDRDEKIHDLAERVGEVETFIKKLISVRNKAIFFVMVGLVLMQITGYGISTLLKMVAEKWLGG